MTGVKQTKASIKVKKEASLHDVMSSERAVQIEHVTIRSNKPFATVKANLERLVPKLDEGIFQLVADGDIERLKQKLEQGPELAIFLFRDHGGLLKIIGHSSKAVQYDIGNPLTASKMTRHQLAAGLYAPLRVILYEDKTGSWHHRGLLFGRFGWRRASWHRNKRFPEVTYARPSALFDL